MIKVINKIPAYRNDGYRETECSVESHWDDNELIWITVGKEKARVLAADLEAAIKNATNMG